MGDADKRVGVFGCLGRFHELGEPCRGSAPVLPGVNEAREAVA